jgi:hypothetical protein
MTLVIGLSWTVVTLWRRPKIVWELVADLWNDINWEPTTQVFPELHSDFIVGETIHHDLVLDMRHATAEHIQNKYVSMNAALNRVIGNWERSGQGEFGYQGEGDYDAEEDGEEGDTRPNRPTYGVLISTDEGTRRHDGAL